MALKSPQCTPKRCAFLFELKKYNLRKIINKMANPAKFIREVRQEMNKVVWPTRKETVVSTIMVLVLVVVAALFFFVADNLISWGVRLILGMGGQG